MIRRVLFNGTSFLTLTSMHAATRQRPNNGLSVQEILARSCERVRLPWAAHDGMRFIVRGPLTRCASQVKVSRAFPMLPQAAAGFLL